MVWNGEKIGQITFFQGSRFNLATILGQFVLVFLVVQLYVSLVLIYFASLEPMNTSCQIKILRNPISARLIAHSFFRVWLKSGCSTKYFSMNMFPQCRMTMGKAKVRWVAFCRSLPRGEFLCEALHHWSATANQEMPLVMIFDDLWWFLNFWSWMIVDLWTFDLWWPLIFDLWWSLNFWYFDLWSW